MPDQPPYEPSSDDYEIHVFTEDVRSFPLGGGYGPVKALICRRCGCLVGDFQKHDEQHATAQSASSKPSQ
jgi:hypothetical protein